jgi:hypothetical protein
MQRSLSVHAHLLPILAGAAQHDCMQIHTARQITQLITEFVGPQRRPPAKTATTIIPVCLFLLMGASSLAANEVTERNDIAGRATFASGLAGNPLYESRVNAITHAAVHDALNGVDSSLRAVRLSRTVDAGRFGRSGRRRSRTSCLG